MKTCENLDKTQVRDPDGRKPLAVTRCQPLQLTCPFFSLFFCIKLCQSTGQQFLLLFQVATWTLSHKTLDSLHEWHLLLSTFATRHMTETDEEVLLQEVRFAFGENSFSEDKRNFDVCWTVHHCDNWRIRTNQLDATCYFIVLLIGSTCCGHYYAHHQELATIMLITTLVVSFLVWCMLEVRCG